MRSAFSPWAAGLSVLGLVALSSAPLQGETLENIGKTGNFNVCANPDAMPYASEASDNPGFQLDLQQAIAQLMGWQATVTWLHNRQAAARLGCGGFMGRSIHDDPDSHLAGALRPSASHRVTRAYLGTGYVVVLPVGSRTRFASLGELAADDLIRRGKPMGVGLGVSAAVQLQQAGIATVSYLYQEQIIAGVLAGDLSAGLVARENAAWFLRRRPGTFAQFELFRVDPAFRWNVGMDLRGADAGLIAAINQIIGRFSRDGTLERIMARYGIAYQPPFPEG